LYEKLEKAPAKEKDGIHAQLDNVRERFTTMLPLLVELRDMALDGRQLMLPLLNRRFRWSPMNGQPEWVRAA